MFKKVGFTLAEVLITLTIIGVVAMMTLPALMTNVQEQQAITGLKKGINTLTEAGQMNAAVAGYDYSSVTSAGADDGDQSLVNLFTSRLQVDLTMSNIGTSSGNGTAISKILTGDTTGGTGYTVVFLRDGAAIAFPTDTKVTTGVDHVNVYYDTNGAKGPNVLSNCEADTAKHIASATPSGNNTVVDPEESEETETGWYNGFMAPAYADDAPAHSCTNKADRVIRDQYELILKGGYASPVDNEISQWIINNK